MYEAVNVWVCVSVLGSEGDYWGSIIHERTISALQRSPRLCRLCWSQSCQWRWSLLWSSRYYIGTLQYMHLTLIHTYILEELMQNVGALLKAIACVAKYIYVDIWTLWLQRSDAKCMHVDQLRQLTLFNAPRARWLLALTVVVESSVEQTQERDTSLCTVRWGSVTVWQWEWVWGREKWWWCDPFATGSSQWHVWLCHRAAVFNTGESVRGTVYCRAI